MKPTEIPSNFTWACVGDVVYITSWRACNQWPVPPGLCVLPELDPSQWKPIDRVLTIRCPEISPFDFLYIAIGFGDVYYVKWSEYFVTVRFLSKEQTDRCFNEFARKGFEVAITAELPHLTPDILAHGPRQNGDDAGSQMMLQETSKARKEDAAERSAENGFTRQNEATR